VPYSIKVLQLSWQGAVKHTVSANDPGLRKKRKGGGWHYINISTWDAGGRGLASGQNHTSIKTTLRKHQQRNDSKVLCYQVHPYTNVTVETTIS
jgi:hypothetical protein